jgi:hypothetical protein
MGDLGTSHELLLIENLALGMIQGFHVLTCMVIGGRVSQVTWASKATVTCTMISTPLNQAKDSNLVNLSPRCSVGSD